MKKEYRIKNHEKWLINHILWINNLIKEDWKMKKCEWDKYY
jgi:hypothetical protein